MQTAFRKEITSIFRAFRPSGAPLLPDHHGFRPKQSISIMLDLYRIELNDDGKLGGGEGDDEDIGEASVPEDIMSIRGDRPDDVLLREEMDYHQMTERPDDEEPPSGDLSYCSEDEILNTRHAGTRNPENFGVGKDTSNAKVRFILVVVIVIVIFSHHTISRWHAVPITLRTSVTHFQTSHKFDSNGSDVVYLTLMHSPYPIITYVFSA